MTVHIHHDGPVTTICIDRPQVRNAVDRQTARALYEAFRAFDASDAAVAVLTGAGNTFCAGSDLQAVADGELPVLEATGDEGPMGPTRLQLQKPVIAAIEGHAVAGGLELALWCDLRVASSTAVLGVFCRRFGVPLIDGGTVRLPRIIGMGRAMDLILTGRPVHADEALQMGLVNRVVPPGDALACAQAMAADIARFPQACLQADRANVYSQANHPESAALLQEFASSIHVLASEALQGARRFADGAGRHGVFDAAHAPLVTPDKSP